MFLAFWGRVLRVAFVRFGHDKQLAENVWGVLLPLLVLGVPILASLSDWAPLWVRALPVFIYIFLWAPAHVWAEERSRANRAERVLQPSIRLHPVTVRTEYGRFARLKVTNDGIQQLRDCCGHLLNLDWKHDGTDKPPYVAGYLPWSAGDGGGRYLTFQSVGFLDVASLDDLYMGRVRIHGHGAKHDTAAWVPEHGYWVFTLEVTAENSSPVRGRYELSVEPLGQHAKPDSSGSLESQELPMLNFRSLG